MSICTITPDTLSNLGMGYMMSVIVSAGITSLMYIMTPWQPTGAELVANVFAWPLMIVAYTISAIKNVILR